MPKQIVLALSGGGFRATIFHLGILRWLKDSQLLGSVKLVAAVSGGSITAADLVLNWESYTHSSEDRFLRREAQIRRLTEIGLRNRLVRRSLWYGIGRRLRLMRNYTLTNRLARYYSDYLYNTNTLYDLKAEVDRHNAPYLMLVTTSLNQPTDLCYFAPEGFYRFPASGNTQHVPCDAYEISNAVAASSAYPMLFPPLEFSAEVLNMAAITFGVPDLHYLTDGGVFENLGLSALVKTCEVQQIQDPLFVVCNAGRQIDWDFRTPYSRRMLLALLRSSEVAQYWSEQRLIKRAPEGTIMINIWDTLPSPPGPPVQIQASAARIRTDFDQFSDLEWQLLYDHGYSLANAQLRHIVERA